jgi:hypothetical protein
LRLIIAYKLAKAPLLLLLALYLSLEPAAAYGVARRLLVALTERGGLWLLLEHKIEPWITYRALTGVRLLAWGDGALTLLEGILLFRGKRWGEWLVALVLAALLPIEVVALVVHRQPGRLGVFLVNLAVVVYLLRNLLRHETARASGGRVSGGEAA